MTKENKQTISATSPRGIAKWPKLTTPDEYQGKVFFATSLVVSKGAPGVSEYCALIGKVAGEHIAKLIAEAKTPAVAKKLQAYHVSLPYEDELNDQGEETGNVVFKYKSNATYKDKKSGETKQSVIRFFDSFGTPCKVNPWGGTEMKVAADLFAFENAAAEKYGVSLRIKAVQIIKLKTGGSGADASEFGFGEEADGFDGSQQEEPESSEPAPAGLVDGKDF